MQSEKKSLRGRQGSTQLWFEVMLGKAPAFVNNNLLYAVRGFDAGQKRLPIDWKLF